MNLNKIWLFINICQIAYLFICGSLFLLTSMMYYQLLYFIGFFLYIICGATILLIISCNVFKTITNSIHVLHKSTSIHYHDYIYNDNKKDDNNSSGKSALALTPKPSNNVSTQNPNGIAKITEKNDINAKHANIVDPIWISSHLQRAKCVVISTIVAAFIFKIVTC